MTPIASSSVQLNAEGSNLIALTGSGANPYIEVGIEIRHSGGATPVSAVTWNGIALIPLIQYTDSILFAEIWGWNPANGACPTGSHNVVVTSDGGSYGFAVATFWSDVDPVTPLANTASFSSDSASSPHNRTITTPSGGYAVDVAAIATSSGTAPTTPVIQNSATQVRADDGNFWGCGGGGYKLNATQLGWAWTPGSGTYIYVQVAASFNPAGGATVPDAPTIGTAVAGNAEAYVNATSNSDGGSALTTPKHTATSTPGGFTGTSATYPITVTGLANGTPYTFKTKDHNAIAGGYSAESAASNSVTPTSAGGGGVRRTSGDMGGF